VVNRGIARMSHFLMALPSVSYGRSSVCLKKIKQTSALPLR
jgi:hypothetical protein